MDTSNIDITVTLFMVGFNEQLGHLIRARRDVLRLKQRVIGKRLGVSQAAVSLVEGGEIKAISPDKLKALLEMLDLPPDAGSGAVTEDASTTPAASEKLVCCPNPTCLSGVPFIQGKRVFVRPRFYFIPAGESLCCVDCSAALIDKCQTCGADLLEGASCCRVCGDPYSQYDIRFKKNDIVEFVEEREADRVRYKDTPLVVRLSGKPQNKITTKEMVKRHSG